jgi:hypothetical protein
MFLSIIIDGADQQKNGVPRYCEKTYALQGAWRMPIHVYGALVHGYDPQIFLIPDHVRQGVNVTVEVLQRTLRQLEEDGVELPPTLYLQLDNTAKQNKSRFLIAYLGELVKMGVFQNVYVSFLPVGHTHEDIDQLFSRLATAMKYKNSVTMEEMAEIFEGAYCTAQGKRPTVSIVTEVANISDHVDKKTSNWSALGIAQYYQFHIFCDSDGVSQVRARQSSTGDEEFRGLHRRSYESCTTETSILEDPNDRIIWKDIGPAQRKEIPYDTLIHYKDTMRKAYDQWGFSDDQFESLTNLWKLLDSPDDIPFHWFKPITGTHGKPLLPFKRLLYSGSVPAPAPAVGPATHGMPDSKSEVSTCQPGVPGGALARRGPGSVGYNPFCPISSMQIASSSRLSQPGVPGGALARRGPGSVGYNPFCPISSMQIASSSHLSAGRGVTGTRSTVAAVSAALAAVAAVGGEPGNGMSSVREGKSQTTPYTGWHPFVVGDDVLIRPDEMDEFKDGFWLGRLVDTPPPDPNDPDDIRQEGAVYIGVHWYARKPTCLEKKRPWYQAKFELQYIKARSWAPERPHVTAVQKSTITQVISLNKNGSITKKGGHWDNVNYVRKRYWDLAPDPPEESPQSKRRRRG